MNTQPPTKETVAAVEAAHAATVRPTMPDSLMEGFRHTDMEPLGQLSVPACHLAALIDKIDGRARAKSEAGENHLQEIADYRHVARAFTTLAGRQFPVLVQQESMIQFTPDWNIEYKSVQPRVATIALFGCTEAEARAVAEALRGRVRGTPTH